MNYKEPISYAAKHKADEVRRYSRSGGVFTAISDVILQQGGVIYGCSMNEELKAVHIRAEDAQERDRCRGSKYVQSNMTDIFHQVKEDLQGNRNVLFTGTPCQCRGIYKYLEVQKVNTDKLVLADILCHGVASPLLLEEFIRFQERKCRGRVSEINFRNKVRYGWSSHVETITVNGRQKDSDIYAKLFYNNNGLRHSCYQCPFKSVRRLTDITLADFWGIDQAVQGFNDNKGVSLVLVNSDKGSRYFELCKDSLHYEACSIKKCMQPALRGPFKSPPDRDKFWTDYHRMSFEKLINKYIIEKNLYWRIKVQLKYWLYSRFKE